MINIPTLIIWGEFDKVIPVEIGYKLNDLIKDSELKIIKGTGHVPHEEIPQEFMSILYEFLEKE